MEKEKNIIAFPPVLDFGLFWYKKKTLHTAHYSRFLSNLSPNFMANTIK